MLGMMNNGYGEEVEFYAAPRRKLSSKANKEDMDRLSHVFGTPRPKLAISYLPGGYL